MKFIFDHIQDPRWGTTHEEEEPHKRAYIKAFQNQLLPDSPERILFKYSEHEAAEAIGI